MSIAYKSSGGHTLASEYDLAARFVAESGLTTISMRATQTAHRARRAGFLPGETFDKVRKANVYQQLRLLAREDEAVRDAWHDFKAKELGK